MNSIHRKLPFCLALLCLSFTQGCGGGEEETELIIPDSPPQITITLRSDLVIEQPLDPDPQFDSSKQPDKLAALTPESKKKRKIFGRKKPPMPAFKADEGYQSLNRFENASKETFKIKFEKKPEPKKKRVRKTVKIQDKPLVFGGRGFNIEAFDHEVNPAVEVDYVSHLREPPPHPLPVGAADHLDPNGEYSRDTKDLIYGDTRIAFGKMPPPLVEAEPREQKVETPLSIEKHPDSVLVFPPGEDSIALVAKDENSLDLLIGNETLNKKRFRSE
ncbi:MAG: hypothetical protein VW455_01675 [Nitrospinota bacterium]